MSTTCELPPDVDLVGGLPRRELIQRLHYHRRQGELAERAIGFYLLEMHRGRTYAPGARSAAEWARRHLGILHAERRPLVSVDFNHDPHSAVVDLPSLMVVDRSLVKVLAWYDNEWAYAMRTAEMAHRMWAQEP